jgi:hypothetical protein
MWLHLEHSTFQSRPILQPRRFSLNVGQTLSSVVGGRELQTGLMAEELQIRRMDMQQRDKEPTSIEGLVKGPNERVVGQQSYLRKWLPKEGCHRFRSLTCFCKLERNFRHSQQKRTGRKTNSEQPPTNIPTGPWVLKLVCNIP